MKFSIAVNCRLLCVAMLCWQTAAAAPYKAKADAHNPRQVQRGERVYQRFCSICHGRHLQGQPNWRKRKPNGKLPAPPHDESGHSWHHPDQVLFDMTKFGMVPPYAPENYRSDMPGWGETLKDEDIWAVIAFIKSRWPQQQRKFQAERNREAEQESNGQ